VSKSKATIKREQQKVAARRRAKKKLVHAASRPTPNLIEYLGAFLEFDPGQAAAAFGGSWEIVCVDLESPAFARLGDVLRRSDYSFRLPSDLREFPLLLKHESESACSYAYQYVQAATVFSCKMQRQVVVPFVTTCNPDWGSFLRSYSIVHELIHVVQQVCRVSSRDTPEWRIAAGIEDELEVQLIMCRAFPELAFDLKPTLYRVKKLRERDGTDAECVGRALDMIGFSKYEVMSAGGIRSQIQATLGAIGDEAHGE
jgi:hypothetical protein